jgi:uncharacterized lipoprotein YmbA
MIMSTTNGTIGVAAIMLVTLTGCSLGRTSQPLEQYVLGGTSVVQQVTSSDATSPPAADGLTIGMRRLDLAPYLASPAIVVRRGTQQIMTSEYHRWGEDPGAGISRAVARYLIVPGATAGMTIRAVDVAPWPARARHDYLVQLHVARFEGTASEDSAATIGEAHVQATWEIIRQVDGVVLARGLTDHVQDGWRVGDYAALVTLLDGGLIALVGEVADCLRRLERDRSAGSAGAGGADGVGSAAVANGSTTAEGAVARVRELTCGATSRT